MEGGGRPFFPSGHHQPETSRGFNILPAEFPVAEDREAVPVDAGINEKRPAPHAAMRQPDHYVPLSNVTRIMRQILPPHARISKDAKQTLQVCVSEFICFLTGEANNRCQQDRRITVTPDDVLWAVRNLGFHDYVEPITAFLSSHRDADGGRYAPRGSTCWLPHMRLLFRRLMGRVIFRGTRTLGGWAVITGVACRVPVAPAMMTHLITLKRDRFRVSGGSGRDIHEVEREGRRTNA